MVKQCKECKKEKALNEFYRHRQMVDGRLNFCKTCIKKRVRQYVKNNFEKASQCTKAWRMRNKKKTRAYSKNRRQTEAGKIYMRNYLKNTPGAQKKHSCRQKLVNAIRYGKIRKRNICEMCYVKGTECHHDDYNKPFDFMELCKPCHTNLHA